MSPALQRFVAIALALEVAVCGWLAVGRLLRPKASIPAEFPDDPLLAGEFATLAQRAENGGAEDWLSLGESLLGQGCYGHAEKAFERALEIDPDNIEACYGLAFALDRTGRVRESNVLYQRCVDTPDDPKAQPQQSKKPFALFAIGKNHLRLGDVAAAEGAFRRNEGFVPALYQLARILHYSGRPNEAAALLSRLLARVPLSLELHLLRARVMETLGEPAEQFVAAAMAERSAHLVESYFGTDYVRPFNQRQGLKRALDAYDSRKSSGPPAVMDAELASIEEIVRDRRIPQRLVALSMRGERSLAEGKPAAIPEIARQIAAGGDAGSSRLLLEAAAKEMQGDADGARALRERSERLLPSMLVERALADDCERRGDIAGRDRHRAKEHFLAAMGAYRTNKLEPALELFKKSAAIAPDDATTWFHIGEMEYHLGRRDAADDAFRKALELRPGHGRARDYLDRRAP
jgi:tetratricopeptide (TPR) repeat protein